MLSRASRRLLYLSVCTPLLHRGIGSLSDRASAKTGPSQASSPNRQPRRWKPHPLGPLYDPESNGFVSTRIQPAQAREDGKKKSRLSPPLHPIDFPASVDTPFAPFPKHTRARSKGNRRTSWGKGGKIFARSILAPTKEGMAGRRKATRGAPERSFSDSGFFGNPHPSSWRVYPTRLNTTRLESERPGI
ncbi:hypothetical protein LZ31DRAFT_91363 [Colletotrichum somersetense]|nr:hypothetical protein LZ31DRAFT_91363 [Colletotrichum somersetense]